AALGPDAAACRPGGGPALLVNVDGFKARTGNLRVNVYGDADTFLDRGRYLRQINLAVTRAGAMPVCVRLPRSGQFAVAVRHDVDGDGNDWGDGGGFSRNPRLSLTSLRPRFQNVAINVGAGMLGVGVVLNYRFGLSIRPVRG
ncbi:MAG TPA: DUF2141 domain-containing protein, partial [Allosphingosinicella sp.]|nr:DUF2141 domain-containing protein [Allosphingosinicella sp.]